MAYEIWHMKRVRFHRTSLTITLLALIVPLGRTRATQQQLQSGAQSAAAMFEAIEEMIPMRDGVKLYTVICLPKKSAERLPILLRRTPYGSETGIAGDLPRSEEHTSELQSLRHLVCRLLLEKKKNKHTTPRNIQ